MFFHAFFQTLNLFGGLWLGGVALSVFLMDCLSVGGAVCFSSDVQVFLLFMVGFDMNAERINMLVQDVMHSYMSVSMVTQDRSHKSFLMKWHAN